MELGFFDNMEYWQKEQLLEEQRKLADILRPSTVEGCDFDNLVVPPPPTVTNAEFVQRMKRPYPFASTHNNNRNIRTSSVRDSPASSSSNHSII